MKFIMGIVLMLGLFFAEIAFAEPNSITQTSLPLQFNTGNPAPYGLPSTVITIQGKSIPLIFDTGADKDELVLGQDLVKKLKVVFTGKKICGTAVDGKFCGREFIIPEVKLGDFIVKNVKGSEITHLWDSHDNTGFQETAAARNGVIGLALLSKFNILLDYPQAKAILVQPKNKLFTYDIDHWIAIPFSDRLRTSLKLNGKLMTMGWDTGSIPSIIKQSSVQDLKKAACPSNAPYAKDCSGIITTIFQTTKGENLPNTWFKIRDIPAAAPFDALLGSNFYANNLIYFDFDHHAVYIKPNKS